MFAPIRPDARFPTVLGMDGTNLDGFFCLACAGPLAAGLAGAGSRRCDGCRVLDRPLRVDLYARRRALLGRPAGLPEAA